MGNAGWGVCEIPGVDLGTDEQSAHCRNQNFQVVLGANLMKNNLNSWNLL